MPHLPDEGWGISGQQLHYRPNKWIACVISPVHYRGAKWFALSEVIQFLGAPSSTLNGPVFHDLGSARGQGVIDMFSNVDDAALAMAKLVRLVKSESIPRFETIGTIDGFLDSLKDMYARSPKSFFFPERICYLEIIRGNLDRAREASRKAVEAVGEDDTPEVAQVGRRVAEIMTLAHSDYEAAVNRLTNWADETWKTISKI